MSRPAPMDDAEARTLLSEARDLGEQMSAAMVAAERRREVLRDLHDGGWSIRRIAAELGLSGSAVAQALKARG